jgi:2-dehydro-3-deoxygalactonokinase
VKPLIAIDWGTSSLRAARLGPQGQVLEERASAQGILAVPPDGFSAVFDALCAGWLQGDTLALMSGMVGSRQGWLEAPYCECPAGFDEVACRLTWLRPGQLAIVPGLRCEHDGVPDVMRGEEVQVFGALQQLGLDDATLVLPGTHSKWVTVRARRIEQFCTYMTGEFYALLRQHSILSRTLPADEGPLQEDAFDQGVDQALHGPSLLATAFSTRTLALFERLAPQALPSYLSGLVIGEELRAQAPGSGPVVVMGGPALASRYERALARCGVAARRADAHATWHGLWAIGQTLEP